MSLDPKLAGFREYLTHADPQFYIWYIEWANERVEMDYEHSIRLDQLFNGYELANDPIIRLRELLNLPLADEDKE